MRLRQAEILMRRGILYLGKTAPDEATRLFKQALIDRAWDLNLQTYLGLAFFNAKQYETALYAFRRVLDVAPGNIVALIGSALASIELADDGDADQYKCAEQCLTDALKHGRDRESGSIRLNKDKDKEVIADIYYMRGYAKAKRHEAGRGELHTIVSAINDFRLSLRADSRHILARAAVEKLSQRMLRNFAESSVEREGQFLAFLFSAGLFLMAQLDFLLPNTEFLHRALGLPTQSVLKEPGYYVGVTFGALAIMIAVLSLPKLLTLKLPGIELKKASTDQVALVPFLEMRRSGLFQKFLLSRLRGLNAPPPDIPKPPAAGMAEQQETKKVAEKSDLSQPSPRRK